MRNAKIEGIKANAVCLEYIFEWLIMSEMRNECERYFVRMKKVVSLHRQFPPRFPLE